MRIKNEILYLRPGLSLILYEYKKEKVQDINNVMAREM